MKNYLSAALAVALTTFSALSNAAISLLLAGTTVTATFESKDAMTWRRLGGAEILNIKGVPECKIVASTEADKQSQSSKLPIGIVTPLTLACNEGRTAYPATSILLPARVMLSDKVPDQVEFIVAKPLEGYFIPAGNVLDVPLPSK